MILHRIPLVLLALATSCSHESRESFAYTFVDGADGTTIETGGVRIEVDRSVRFLSVSHSSSSGELSSESTLDGHRFGVREGVFFLGEREYGAAREGSVVRVSATGVSVDGEERGPLPPPAPPAR